MIAVLFEIQCTLFDGYGGGSYTYIYLSYNGHSFVYWIRVDSTITVDMPGHTLSNPACNVPSVYAHCDFGLNVQVYLIIHLDTCAFN